MLTYFFQGVMIFSRSLAAFAAVLISSLVIDNVESSFAAMSIDLGTQFIKVILSPSV